MKRNFLLSVLMVMILSACNWNTWVLDKDRLSENSDIEAYVQSLQQVHTDFRGHYVLTVAEGRKMVIVSTGSNATTLAFKDAEISHDKTVVTVDELNNQSTDEVNSFILIGIDEIKGDLVVVNADGEEFLSFD